MIIFSVCGTTYALLGTGLAFLLFVRDFRSVGEEEACVLERFARLASPLPPPAAVWLRRFLVSFAVICRTQL
jgi:hypothetical protein